MATARQQIALARAQQSKSSALARSRARTSEALAKMRKRMATMKISQRADQAGGAVLVLGGAALAGQTYKLDLFPNDQGMSRAPLIGAAIGGLGAVGILGGYARTRTTMGAAAVAIGVGAGTLAIYSHQNWDLLGRFNN